MKLNYLVLLMLFIACSPNKKTSPKVVDTKVELENFELPTVTNVNSLNDTLLPIINRLIDYPKPITVKAGKPNEFYLPTSKSLKDTTKLIIHPEAQGVGLFTTYTSNEGLAMDVIGLGQGALTLDRNGNIWMATQGGGVSRYDGESFKTYTTTNGLIDNTVLGILEDSSGNLWFGTYGGVSKYDGEIFKSFTTEDGLANNAVFSVLEDKNGNIWFGTDGVGVSKFDGQSFSTYTIEQGLSDNYVRSMLEDKNGNIWFGTYAGVSMYDGKKFTNYNTSDGLANNSVLSMKEDGAGNLWIGTYGGVSKFDGEMFRTYNTEQGLANNTVYSILEDRNKNLWFGTYSGVSRYDGQSFSTYSTNQGLVNNSVFSILEDNIGNLWFGTPGGVSKYKGKMFSTFTTAEGLTNNSVFSILEDKIGNLWFGTYGGGVSRYDGVKMSTYTTTQGLAYNSIYSMLEDSEGNLWFGTYGNGVSKFNGQTFINYTTKQGLANNYVRSICEDKNGNIWFGTYGGVTKYNGQAMNSCHNGTCNHNVEDQKDLKKHQTNISETFTNYSASQGLADNSIFSILEDNKGDLWFGTSNGVSKFDGENFSTYRVEQGLANNSVFSMLEDRKGNLWLGTYGGGISILMLQNENEEDTFLNLTTENGLTDNGVASLRQDDDGNIMIGTNFGLFVLDSSQVNKLTASNSSLPNKLNGQTYNQFNGYPIKDVNVGQNNGAMHIDSHGVLWIGHGSNGVTRVDLGAEHMNTNAPNLVINKVDLVGENICFYSIESNNEKLDSVIQTQQEIAAYGNRLTQAERDTLNKKFNGVTYDSISKWYPLPQNLVLPYQHNALTFEFNAIETDRNFMVNYQFMLKDMNEEWSPITKKKEATYNNLSEGDYTFLVKAQSPWGVWSEPIEFDFVVLPPWYRTWWAYVCYVLLAMLFIRMLIRMQTKKLKQRQLELETEVENATQEINNTLKIVEQQKEQVEEAHKEITDSINYAERIQRSFLATNELLNKNIGFSSSADKDGVSKTEPNYFVFFKPKDVVSGDFYWADTLSNGTFAMVNADSTGHGVPGAIMSILNISSIESAVKEGLTNPADIFNSTRKTIIERLKKDGSEHGGKDGMDASIICYDFTTLKMTYCAAQNPIWIIRNGEVIQIKPEKMPIGKHDHDHIPFVGGEFEMQKGDKIYTITDGFQDQFGGPKGKKFMIKNMRQFVLENSHLPMAEQHQKIADAFSNWQGNLEQVDDVCVIGICV